MGAKTTLLPVTCHECGSSISRNVPASNPGKKFFCGQNCKAVWQRKSPRLASSVLMKMYWADGMTCVDIAKAVGRDPKTVWSWMKGYGLATNPRGADDRQLFKAGDPSPFTGMKHTDAAKEKIRQARIADGSKGLFRANGDHVLKGVRGAAHPSWQGGCTPLRQSFYASDEWKAACVAVWHRADAKCERCGMDHRTIDRTKFAFHVHHVAGFLKYPDLRADPDNLKLLCQTCHKWVHGKANINKELIRR